MNFSEIEKNILKFWEENKIFQKSIKNRERAKNFVFYEGPPTANAKPGIHHVLARAFKDIVCRYKTMRGFRVERKAGWDTHGLPVELEIEKKLGLKNKKDIERHGIADFCRRCKASVFDYKKDWEKLTKRIGFWIDMENPYITYEVSYIESVWWILKQIKEKGLLYQDYKIVPFCPRCSTPLSGHEVAQGYKRVREKAVYVKFKLKNQTNTYFLVWTTTPWTLPANVALAVNPRFDYVKVKIGTEYYILLKEKTKILEKEFETKDSFKGEKLINTEYEPLFPYLMNLKPENIENAFRVLPADFVSEEEGTGIVHIAVMYGEEDFQLGKKFDLPFYHTIDEAGCFKKEIKEWQGIFVKDADPRIVKKLKDKKLLFKEEFYEHDYPFCWRCKTPLLYYARKSWFIKMSLLRKKLIESNKKINWIPSHIKKGRFGEWLKDLKDWALSRERFWGTPLPVWKCQVCKNVKLIESKKDLLNQKFSENSYILLRHGYSVADKRRVIVSLPEKLKSPLTPKGEKQVKSILKKLKKQGIEYIFSSDSLSARQTAEIIGDALGIKPVYDKRLREIKAGSFEGESVKKYEGFWSNYQERFSKKPKQGESYNEVKIRIYRFLKQLDRKYYKKKILIISHQIALDMLRGAVEGFDVEEFLRKIKPNPIKPSEIKKIKFRNLPYNDKGELDFHRPFIDEIEFYCEKCGGRMKRVTDVIDCWFDSGSMPFAQYHYPFENKDLIDEKKQFPADYICEGVDQTRGWFYTLLAISTLLGKGPAYKNVISLGLILDDKGRKMSKSLGNIVDPWYVVEKYGADSVRWYFYTTNQPGEAKCFSERDLFDAKKRFLMTLWNSYAFFDTYVARSDITLLNRKVKGVLNKWILSRLNELILEVTSLLERYDITTAGRKIQNFTCEDLSQWYIRRSRRNFQKPEFKDLLKEDSATLGFVLLTLSKLTAPFIPFLSEEIYQKLRTKLKNINFKRSVHLENWPVPQKNLIDRELNKKMVLARELTTSILKERVRFGIKVRQPLSKAEIPKELFSELDKEVLDLVKEETNIKKLVLSTKLKLDTNITPELKEEGILREIVRIIQQVRKEAGLRPLQKVSVEIYGTDFLNRIVEKNRGFITNEAGIKMLKINKDSARSLRYKKNAEIDKQPFWIGVLN
jgi:isoleucyl-tRNA synthetase